MNITKYKNLSLGSVLLAVLSFPASVQSAPLISIGDNVDVLFNGSTSLLWSSNVFRDEEDELDDIIWTISPGFEVNVGRGLSNADLSIITRYDIVRYSDLDQLDTELFHIKAIGSYETSRLDLSGSVSFDESKASSGNLNFQDMIESDSFAARLDGEYRVSPKFSVGSGVSYSDREYQTYEEYFADREGITIPLDVFYELTPKVDLSLGYAYTQTDVGETNRPIIEGVSSTFVSDYESRSHFFNIGARGQLLPKLSGFFKIGYRTRESDDSTIQTLLLGVPVASAQTNRGDSGRLGFDADFTWNTTAKLTTGLGLSRDFGIGSEGDTTEISRVDVNASYSINTNWSSQASAGYTLRDHESGREDHQYRLGLRLSYVPNQHWRFSGGYSYIENDSDTDDRSYESHTLDITANLRY
ncbi:MAG: outer membrane beta-barrel protein [Opitutaceae bacterium]